LAETVKKLCRSQSEIVFTPYETAYGPGFDDMPRRVPSLARAGRLLNWRPQLSLEQIILQTAEFIAANPPATLAK
jgi:UDP-glucose 4-epimerase